jgi:hypothetical protein
MDSVFQGLKLNGLTHCSTHFTEEVTGSLGDCDGVVRSLLAEGACIDRVGFEQYREWSHQGWRD